MRKIKIISMIPKDFGTSEIVVTYSIQTDNDELLTPTNPQE